MIRVMIITQHAGVSEGLRTVLGLADSIEAADIVPGWREALDQAGRICPDVVMVDLEMPPGEGFQAIWQVKRAFPTLPVLALTAHEEPAVRRQACQAGACGLIIKGQALPEMVAAIQAARRTKEIDHGRES